MNAPAPNDATRRQISAARPDVSTWLSANAGSGKTRVLTDRVARLLLGGVDPQNILCLTYTKAAASEMQNRLFKRLGDWAMMPDAALTQALGQLGVGKVDDLRRARTLFAAAIETPGGLKIQTIHSFCAGLLRRFPLEAGVSPQFKEIEDRASDLLRAEVLDAMAEGPEATHVAALAALVTDEDFAKLTKRITDLGAGFQTLSRDDALALMGMAPGTTMADVMQTALRSGDVDVLEAILPTMRAAK
ncbi:MAG: UvrD-helicase domain-containing protein, partial [Pseudomonadota bacterium]